MQSWMQMWPPDVGHDKLYVGSPEWHTQNIGNTSCGQQTKDSDSLTSLVCHISQSSYQITGKRRFETPSSLLPTIASTFVHRRQISYLRPFETTVSCWPLVLTKVTKFSRWVDISLIEEIGSVCITLKYRMGHKSLTTLCKSQSMRNRWITTICDLIRPRGKSLGGVTLTAAIL